MTKLPNSNRIAKRAKKVYKSDKNIKYPRSPPETLGTIEEDIEYHVKETQDSPKDNNIHK